MIPIGKEELTAGVVEPTGTGVSTSMLVICGRERGRISSIQACAASCILVPASLFVSSTIPRPNSTAMGLRIQCPTRKKKIKRGNELIHGAESFLERSHRAHPRHASIAVASSVPRSPVEPCDLATTS